jgi:NitT/TauT family transport system permease protein
MHVAAELASIVLIFTSQVWNMVFAWYQSLTTIPKELNEASAIFKQNGWLRFKNLELPFAMISLVWNSIMSFAGGWFFLMAAEIFTVGARAFRLAGIGAYLQEAANQGDYPAIIWGLISLILVIVVLDQFLWRPLLAWSERFKVEMVQGDEPATSWFYEALQSSRMIEVLQQNVVTPLSNRLDMWLQHRLPAGSSAVYNTNKLSRFSWMAWFIPGLFLAFGTYHTISMVLALPLDQWAKIGTGLVATTLRVAAALLIAIGWTIPAGVAIGTNRRLAAFFQPLIQITASIPATALFPVLLVFLLALPGGLNMAAVLLMLMGTQWYLLFNIIAGVNAIPQDLKYTASLLQLNGIERWKTLILPALFPYLITGAITASGGAWNASIVAEYVHFGGQIVSTTGIGSLIAHATAGGDYPLLLAATLSMILAVVLINRLIWRRLYRMAEENYRME